MLTPIKGADRIAFHHKHTWLTKRHVSSFLFGDPHLVAFHHGATAVRADVMQAVRDKDVAGLRCADAVKDVDACLVLPTS